MSRAVPSFRGFVDDAGHLGLDDKPLFKRWLQKLSGQEVTVVVKRVSRLKTLPQLRYLRGVVIPDIARACGYEDPDEWQDVYEGLMFKFRRLADGPFGDPRRQSAADMTIDDMRLLIDEIIIYAETSIPDCQVRRPETVDLERIHDPGWS